MPFKAVHSEAGHMADMDNGWVAGQRRTPLSGRQVRKAYVIQAADMLPKMWTIGSHVVIGVDVSGDMRKLVSHVGLQERPMCRASAAGRVSVSHEPRWW
jgi:hypothetical protein